MTLFRKGTGWIALAMVLFGLMRGTYEGMIMYGDGVREHVAFYMYHAVGFFVLVAFAALMNRILHGDWWTKKEGWFQCALLILGLIIIQWECFEIAYSVARTDIPLFTHEHIVFADLISINITGWQVLALHYLRACVGTIFLITGSMNHEAEPKQPQFI